MRSLVALDLANTKVTDQILTTLAQLPELRTLGLEGTKVSLEAIREFKRQNLRPPSPSALAQSRDVRSMTSM